MTVLSSSTKRAPSYTLEPLFFNLDHFYVFCPHADRPDVPGSFVCQLQFAWRRYWPRSMTSRGRQISQLSLGARELNLQLQTAGWNLRESCRSLSHPTRSRSKGCRVPSQTNPRDPKGSRRLCHRYRVSRLLWAERSASSFFPVDFVALPKDHLRAGFADLEPYFADQLHKQPYVCFT